MSSKNVSRMSLLAIGLFLSVFTLEAEGVLELGLVSYHPLDGNAKDKSIHKYHGTEHGGLSYAQGVSLQAAFFDGTDDYIDIGLEPDFPSWENHSVSVWIKDTGTGQYSGYGAKILSKNTWYCDWYLSVYPDGSICWATCAEYVTRDALTTSDYDYRDSQWHHIAVVKQGSNGLLYVDGQIADCSSNVNTPDTSSLHLLVGYSLSGDHYQRRHFGGMIDELRIYDRPLGPSEVAALSVPEPATIALLGLGGLALLRKRRS